MQAGRLLIGLGYRRVRHYHAGIEGWKEHGGPLESGTAALPYAPNGAIVEPRRPWLPGQRWDSRLINWIQECSTAQLFGVWLATVLACALFYWVDLILRGQGLIVGGHPLDRGWSGLVTSIYFSFVTATSVGYGDVVPAGVMRFLAVAESVTTLLIFGAVVAKFVSYRQEKLVREIHQVSFEERLDRIQTNLHLVFSNLLEISEMLSRTPPPMAYALESRLGSTTMVFVGELRTVHHLLYNPYRTPDEPVLESLLASLAYSLQALASILDSIPGEVRAAGVLAGTLRALVQLASEICADCVPNSFAPSLGGWMDQIHAAAQKIVAG